MDGSRPDKVALVTLGCRVGRADAGSVAGGLPPGFLPAAVGERADWVVVSTCSVTADAAASSRQAVRRAARDHPGARIVVAGCHAAQEGSLLASLPGVAAVVEPRDHPALPGLLAGLRGGAASEAALSAARRAAPPWDAAPEPGAGPARPVLKVQDGCDDACAYCAVPLARGASRSLPLDACLSRLATLGGGSPEVVLSGVHLGAWGRDLRPASSLAGLLRAAAAARTVRRIRLSSVEPSELPLDLLSEEAGGILCDHFHLPLQSGSDRILAAMGRSCSAGAFSRVVEALSRARPAAAIGVDIMAGFPGETEADHRATMSLLASLPIAYFHAFSFSPRPGTRAWAMKDVPRPGDAARRAAEIRELSRVRWASFLGALSGRVLEVVVERVEGARARGTASQRAVVNFPAGSSRRGELVRVRAGDPGVELDRGVAEAPGSA